MQYCPFIYIFIYLYSYEIARNPSPSATAATLAARCPVTRKYPVYVECCPSAPSVCVAAVFGRAARRTPNSPAVTLTGPKTRTRTRTRIQTEAHLANRPSPLLSLLPMSLLPPLPTVVLLLLLLLLQLSPQAVELPRWKRRRCVMCV